MVGEVGIALVSAEGILLAVGSVVGGKFVAVEAITVGIAWVGSTIVYGVLVEVRSATDEVLSIRPHAPTTTNTKDVSQVRSDIV